MAAAVVSDPVIDARKLLDDFDVEDAASKPPTEMPLSEQPLRHRPPQEVEADVQYRAAAHHRVAVDVQL